MGLGNDLTSVAEAVDGARVLRRLAELAEIGADEAGGTSRIAFSPAERQAQDLAAGWMRDAGLDVRFDDFGNMFGSNDGGASGATVSLCGSHLDTVPNGGRFDGALGVVAAIEAVEAMRASRRLPDRPLEVVVWRCEEPVRFAQGKAGSLVFSGMVTMDELRPIEEPPFDLRAALAAEGSRPSRDSTRVVASCLELHIEQGPRLERARRQLGVVTAIAAPIRLEATFRGSAAHSGATPMADRFDALCAAAELVLAVEREATAEAPHESVATTASIRVEPGAMNVVPGEAVLLIDVRGVVGESMRRIASAVHRHAAEIAARRGIHAHVEVLSAADPTPLSPDVVSLLYETVELLGYLPTLLASGAGHDAQCLAGFADVGMLFVPSVEGISHSPHEFTADDDVVVGARALAASWWRVASNQ